MENFIVLVTEVLPVIFVTRMHFYSALLTIVAAHGTSETPLSRISSTILAMKPCNGLNESIFHGGYLTWKKYFDFFSATWWRQNKILFLERTIL